MKSQQNIIELVTIPDNLQHPHPTRPFIGLQHASKANQQARCNYVGKVVDKHAQKFTTELLRMADMYQCEELVSACIEYFKSNITDANSSEIFAVAQELNIKALKEKIFARMIDSKQPLEAIGNKGLADPQDCKLLFQIWQKKYNQEKEARCQK